MNMATTTKPRKRRNVPYEIWTDEDKVKRRDATVPENKIIEHLDTYRKYLGFFREYPDAFIDLISAPDCPVKLYFYQRMFLRVCARYKYVFATFNRAYAKSFLSVMTLYLKCIFYPGIKLFITAGGKEQATKIAKSKIDEMWEWWPILKDEVGRVEQTRDYIKLYFKNGSQLDIMPATETTRGQRKHSGLFEEVIMIDGEKLNKFVIPTLNVDRVAKCGGMDPNEPHKAQIYVTTAGFKTSFAYEKMIQLLVWMIVKGSAFVWGGDYRIPVMHGLLNDNFVDELKEDGTYNPMDFSREYESIWSGTATDVFFSSDQFDKHRVLKEPKYYHDVNTKNPAATFYILGVDVARITAQTVVQVIKATRSGTSYTKSLVNTFVFENRHFEEQAVMIKKVAMDFDAKQIIIDGTGLGVGLIDFLVIDSQDPRTEAYYPPFSVTNDDNYKDYEKPNALPLLHVLKANDELNSQIFVNCLTQFNSNKIKLLVDEKVAKAALLETQEGRSLSSEAKARHLMPFVYTSILKQEMMNLRQKTDGRFLKLEQVVAGKTKDKFSAFVYALWYIKLLEDQEKHTKRKRKFVDFMMYN